MEFLILAAVLAVGIGYVAPAVNSMLAKSVPSLASQSGLVALLIQGAILAAVLVVAHHFIGRKLEA